MDLNASSMPVWLASILALGWKILQIISSVIVKNYYCQFFFFVLIISLVLICCHSGSKIFKMWTLQGCIELSEEYDCIYFLLHQLLLERYKAVYQLFLRFCSSLIDLKQSLKFTAAKSLTSSSVKIFK